MTTASKEMQRSLNETASMDGIDMTPHYPPDINLWRLVPVAMLVLVVLSFFVIGVCICNVLRKIQRQTTNIRVMELQPIIQRNDRDIHMSLGPTIIFQPTEELPYNAKECYWCLEEFFHGKALRSLPPCYHVFHSSCIDPYLARSIGTACPCCRGLISFTEQTDANELA